MYNEGDILWLHKNIPKCQCGFGKHLLQISPYAVQINKEMFVLRTKRYAQLNTQRKKASQVSKAHAILTLVCKQKGLLQKRDDVVELTVHNYNAKFILYRREHNAHISSVFIDCQSKLLSFLCSQVTS